jgi:hypothetical protein
VHDWHKLKLSPGLCDALIFVVYYSIGIEGLSATMLGITR